MKFILGKKTEMVQFYTPEGTVHPATIITVGPLVVTQVKSKDKDGYDAVQVGYEIQKASRVTKPVLGHLKNLGPFKKLTEFTTADHTLNVGDTIDASIFNVGDTVVVSGVSKGKGFQGVVKRYNFKGGPRTHGQKHSEREPGSIGGGLRNRVPKGMRMGGRMGQDKITVKNLKILAVDSGSNIIIVKGALPGRRGTLLEVVSK